jgi:GalNAc5-diNAcBac-PP-undecaprenol beta-1,3-glucosyltransferase
MEPLVSIIIPTYNRELTFQRTIDSLLNQSYKNIELIIVDDGSTDNTRLILQKYREDCRFRILRHPENRGVCAAKNTGLDNISGDWFTILDSDDEIVPQAIEALLKPYQEMDKEITAVTCNCMDNTTRKFAGLGIYKDGYIDSKFIRMSLSGEFWGLTKTQLLENDRFNENLPGFEDVLWNKINKRAKRFYIHQGLRIYHREGSDRITHSNKKASVSNKAGMYRAFTDEIEYLKDIAQADPVGFVKFCFQGYLYSSYSNDNKSARVYYELLQGKKFRCSPAYMLAGKIMPVFKPLFKIYIRIKYRLRKKKD